MTRKNEIIPIKPEDGIPLVDCHCHIPDENPRKGIPESYEEQYNTFFNKHNGQFIITAAGIWGLDFKQNFVKNHDKMHITLGWGAQATTYATSEEWQTDYPKFLNYVKQHPDDYIAIGECGIDFPGSCTYIKSCIKNKIYSFPLVYQFFQFFPLLEIVLKKLMIH